jgi:flagellar hook protein FlgE
MNRTFYNGISGVKSQQFGIDTWGNNISNISTNGYKANIPQFAELFSDKLAQIDNTGPVQSDQGFGARAHSSAIDMSQGSVVKTDRKLDVAIMGNGWFGVTGDGEKVSYTRNGSFSYDKNGDIVNADGSFLMGTLSENLKSGKLNDVSNFIPLAPVDDQTILRMPDNLVLGAVATKKVAIHGNLGIEGVTGKFATNIFTASGEKHSLNIRIEKDYEQPETGTSWTLVATIKNEDGDITFESEPGQILFGGNGGVVKYDKPKIDNEGQNIDLTLGTKFGGLVTLGGEFIGKDIERDGLPQGKLIDYHVDKDGHIVANFDNGRASAVGKIALFHFQNDQGLTKLGDNVFDQSSNSGNAFFYKDALGRDAAGTDLLPYSLEKANVSTAEALTQLIVMQKAFDASAKSITTGDQLLQTALKML